MREAAKVIVGIFPFRLCWCSCTSVTNARRQRECLKEIKETGSPDRHICLMTGWVISVYLGHTPRNHLSMLSSQTLATTRHTNLPFAPHTSQASFPHHLHFTLHYLVKTRNFRHEKEPSNTFKSLRRAIPSAPE